MRRGAPEVVVARVGQLLRVGAVLRPQVPSVRHRVLGQRVGAQLVEADAFDAARCALRTATQARRQRRWCHWVSGTPLLKAEDNYVSRAYSLHVLYTHTIHNPASTAGLMANTVQITSLSHLHGRVLVDLAARPTLKQMSTTAWLRPSASNSCDPLYDATVDTPIFAITCGERHATTTLGVSTELRHETLIWLVSWRHSIGEHCCAVEHNEKTRNWRLNCKRLLEWLHAILYARR